MTMVETTFSKWMYILTLSAFPFIGVFGQHAATDIFLPLDIVNFDYPANKKGSVLNLDEILNTTESALFNNKSIANEYVFNIIHQYVLNKKDTITASTLMKVKIKNNNKSFFVQGKSYKKLNCCENDEHNFARTYFPITYDKYFHVLGMSLDVEELQRDGLQFYPGSVKNEVSHFYFKTAYDNGNLEKETVRLTLEKEKIKHYQKNFIYRDMENYKNLVVREGIYYNSAQSDLYHFIYRTCKVNNMDVDEIVVLYNVQAVDETGNNEKSSWFKVPGSMYEYSTIFSINIIDKSIAEKGLVPKIKRR